MKLLIKSVMVGMFLVIGGAYLYGSRLPREHTATSNLLLVAPPDTVFKVIRNIEASPTWWNDVVAVERIKGASKESWREDMGLLGSIEVEVSSVGPGRVMEVSVRNGAEQGWGGAWYYEVHDTPAGTEVTITEEGWAESPVYRALMKLRGRHRTMDSFLTSLGAHFGESATPRHG